MREPPFFWYSAYKQYSETPGYVEAQNQSVSFQDFFFFLLWSLLKQEILESPRITHIVTPMEPWEFSINKKAPSVEDISDAIKKLVVLRQRIDLRDLLAHLQFYLQTYGDAVWTDEEDKVVYWTDLNFSLLEALKLVVKNQEVKLRKTDKGEYSLMGITVKHGDKQWEPIVLCRA